MQPTLPSGAPDIWNVARRPLDLEDCLAILRRNVGWIAGPALAGLAIAIVTAFLWPDTYVSRAAIRIVPPQVPEQLVPTNLNMRMEERVRSMTQTILSRGSLTHIVETHGLYRKKLQRLPMEDVIEGMRDDIEIGALRPLPGQERTAAFQITFAYGDRRVAQKVASELMTRFMDENTRARSQQSQMTTRFLQDQLEESRSDLDALERQLAEFRAAHMGRLPEQMDANMQQLAVLESRMALLNSSLSRAHQEQIMLESELRGLRDKEAAIQRAAQARASGPGAAADPALAKMDAEITALQTALRQMLEVYKPAYPDVQRLRMRLSGLQRQREAHLDQAGWESGAPKTEAPVSVEEQRDLMEIRQNVQRTEGQILAKELEIGRHASDIAESEAKLKDAQSRIEAGPANLQVYEQLTRDLDFARTRHEDLNRKAALSDIATDVETNQQGETLEVLDLPSLPESPTEPNRPLIVGVGVMLGLVLGLSLTGLREMKDRSLKSLKDVCAYTDFFVLSSVPLLEDDLVIRQRRRAAWVGWSLAALLSLAATAASAHYYYAGQT